MDEQTVFIDGNLLDEAQAGHRPAIAVLAGIAADSLAPSVPVDAGLAWLQAVMRRIAAGEEPNQAFGWNRRGRPRKGHEFERWTWAQWVKTLHEEDGLSIEQAQLVVGKAANRSGPNGAIQVAWGQYRDVAIPDKTSLPPPAVLARIRQFELRVEALRRPRQKP